MGVVCRLRNRLETAGDDDGLKNEIRASIEKQTELLETEQKVSSHLFKGPVVDENRLSFFFTHFIYNIII